ncbi:MAG: hypothetical protein AAGG01_22110, partial [Planctomycetota bacterium]
YPPLEPLVSNASRGLYASWSAERRVGGVEAEELNHLVEASPEWVAPARFFDEYVRRAALTLPERYGSYLTAAEDLDRSGPERARAFYLAGRLGGEAGEQRLRRATDLDPRLGWAWHGLGWRAFSSGDARRAAWAGERAVGLARDPHELAHFSSALARYLAQDQRNAGAQEVLASALARSKSLVLRPDEAEKLGVELAEIELASLAPADLRRGSQRALGLLERPGLTARERLQLTLSLRSTPMQEGHVAEDQIAHALLAGSAGLRATEGPEGAARAAEVLRLSDQLFRGDPSAASGGQGTAFSAAGAALGGPRWSTSSAGVRPADDWARRVAAFSGTLGSGAARSAIEDWAAELPAAARRDDGGLVRVELEGVREALARFTEDDPVAISGLGGALLRAGWFHEARAFAEGVLARASDRSTESADAARALQVDAVRARALLGSLAALAQRIDAREAFVSAGAIGSQPLESLEKGRVESIRELESEIVALFQRYGGLADEAEIESPVIRYGPLGRIVHPGPRFSAEDDALDRGAVGEPVPGLANLFGRLGRFALLGLGVGQGGPDATVLRVVAVESREGEHLGRPFRGTVFWCDGADVPGRFGRRGASISGAALHEGYYVDLSMVRLEEAQWERLRQRFSGDDIAISVAL